MARLVFEDGLQVEWWLGRELKDYAAAKQNDCVYMYADHRELEFIRNYFTGIRGCDCGTGPLIWVGEEAEFIYRNLRISPAVVAGFTNYRKGRP